MNWKVYTDDYYFPHLHIVDSKGKTVAVIPRGMAENKEENMRKAKVMAAAPELLEFAKAIEKWEAKLIRTDECWKSDYDYPKFSKELVDKWMELQEIRNEAIKKAKGDDSNA